MFKKNKLQQRTCKPIDLISSDMDIVHVAVEEVNGTMEVLNLKWEGKKKMYNSVYVYSLTYVYVQRYLFVVLLLYVAQ